MRCIVKEKVAICFWLQVLVTLLLLLYGQLCFSLPYSLFAYVLNVEQEEQEQHGKSLSKSVSTQAKKSPLTDGLP